MAARVSKKFHELVQAECVRREVSLQKLITSAVAAYIESDKAVEDDQEDGPAYLITLGPDPRERLWSTYLDKMPEAKIAQMLAAMKWDLLMRKSARRKTSSKKRGHES